MRGMKTPTRTTCLGLLVLMTASTHAADVPDLSKIERHIRKEPAYKATQPLYGLYVFGPEAKTRVWAIFDKSQPDAADYDILYFDRNADGDLTAPDERIEGKVAAGQVTFHIGSFTDPLTKQQHTEVSITRRAGADATVMLQMKWCDKVLIRGGYAPEPGPYTQFAPTVAKAPVLWPGADGPLSFQFWQLSPLRVGQAEDVRVFLGHQGHGRNTFCALPDTFLPKEVPVLATLLYTDKDGKEQRARSELRERC
ncbi:MAG TPA: hypothetical protein VEL76_29420 [Gemmataceae bacterium]|nr:hypothetical protein [Gemmataceae bacterium]